MTNDEGQKKAKILGVLNLTLSKNQPMHKRINIDTTNLMRKAEDLISNSSNRYRITVQVANRAKRRRYEDYDHPDDPMMKPVLRAIMEMSDELTQPEIIGD